MRAQTSLASAYPADTSLSVLYPSLHDRTCRDGLPCSILHGIFLLRVPQPACSRHCHCVSPSCSARACSPHAQTIAVVVRNISLVRHVQHPWGDMHSRVGPTPTLLQSPMTGDFGDLDFPHADIAGASRLCRSSRREHRVVAGPECALSFGSMH